MGQKVHPHGARVGVIKDWDARWYASKKDFADYLISDHKVRTWIKKNYYDVGISRVEIERLADKIMVGIHAGKPGMIIGKSGTGLDKLKAEIQKMTGKQVQLNVYEVRNPDTDAQLIAENIAAQLERRISFRRAMKQVIGRASRAGVKGIRTMCSGRLGGAEIARSEHYHEGSIPLQTLRANISYGFAEAKTTYGRIGCKVWIYTGEVMPKEFKAILRREAPAPAERNNNNNRNFDRDQQRRRPPQQRNSASGGRRPPEGGRN